MEACESISWRAEWKKKHTLKSENWRAERTFENKLLSDNTYINSTE